MTTQTAPEWVRELTNYGNAPAPLVRASKSATVRPPASVYHNREEWEEVLARGYFFTKSAMSFFSSRVIWDSLTPIPQAAGMFLFITSEKRPEPSEPRRYTIRISSRLTGTDTLGKHEAYATLKQARAALEEVRAATR